MKEIYSPKPNPSALPWVGSLLKEFLDKNKIKNSEELSGYVSKRQAILRKGKGRVSKADRNVDAIVKMAMEQDAEWQGKLKDGGILPQRTYTGEVGSSHLNADEKINWDKNQYDNKNRWEISDKDFEIVGFDKMFEKSKKNPNKVFNVKVGKIIKHPILLKAYPQLNDLTFSYGWSEKVLFLATYNIIENRIKYNFYGEEIKWSRGLDNNGTRYDLRRRVFLHEIQHFIQSIDNLSIGTTELREYKKLLRENGIDEGTISVDDANLYRQKARKINKNSLGELEAKDAEIRIDLTNEEREKIKPFELIPYKIENVTTRNKNDIQKLADGGKINNMEFELTFYYVTAQTDNSTDEIYTGIDFEKSKLEFDSANVSDFPTDNGGTVLFQKQVRKYKFIHELDTEFETIEDYPIEDYYSDSDVYELIDEGEYEDIDSKDVKPINEKSDDLLLDVSSYYKKLYGDWKYNKIVVDNGVDEYDDDYVEYGRIQLRIADHSENVSNNDRFGSADYYISVVIADKNATKNKFLQSIYERRNNEIELSFDSDNNEEEVIESINEAIEEGKEYIKNKFAKGGSIIKNNMEINLKDKSQHYPNSNVLHTSTLSWVLTTDNKGIYHVFPSEMSNEDVFNYYKNKNIIITDCHIEHIKITKDSRDLSLFTEWLEKQVAEHFGTTINKTLFMPKRTDLGEHGFIVDSFDFDLADGRVAHHDANEHKIYIKDKMEKGGSINSPIHKVGDTVYMFEDEPTLYIKNVNEWSDKNATYDIISGDGKISRNNIPESKIHAVKMAKGGSLKKTYTSKDLPKDGSEIKIHMPAMLHFPAEDITAKYNNASFMFNLYRNGELAAGQVGEKEILENLNNGLYELVGNDKVDKKGWDELSSRVKANRLRQEAIPMSTHNKNFERFKKQLDSAKTVAELNEKYKQISDNINYIDMPANMQNDVAEYVEELESNLLMVPISNGVKTVLHINYKDAIKSPKGGAKNMNKNNIQASAAETIASNHAMRGEAIYDWANKHNINLIDFGHILSKKDSGIMEDVLNDTTNSVSKMEKGGTVNKSEVYTYGQIDGKPYEVIGLNEKLGLVRVKNFGEGTVKEMKINEWIPYTFELGTPATFIDEGREVSGEIVMRNGNKAISLYKDSNYSGDSERIRFLNEIDLSTLKSFMSNKETFEKGGSINSSLQDKKEELQDKLFKDESFLKGLRPADSLKLNDKIADAKSIEELDLLIKKFGKIADTNQKNLNELIGKLKPQSLTFEKDKFNLEEAKEWALKNGFIVGKTKVTDNLITITQKDPSTFIKTSIEKIGLGGGVWANAGKLKRAYI